MALPKLYEQIVWHNDTTPAINQDNLNSMSQALKDIDNRVIELAGTIMEDVPEIIESLEIIEPAIETINQSVAAATAAASTATTKASEASGSASTASTKAGEASSSASTASTKAGEAATSAQTASTKAGEAATSATNAANSATAAAASASQAEAWSANPPYIGANGNWYVYDTTTEAYVDSGIDASITMNVGTVTTLEAGQPATVTNSGTSTDAIFNFGIPQGIQGIQGPQGEQGIQGERGIQGIQGETGATGATPNITMTATADAVSSDNPSVNITKSGTAENPSFALAFSGLKGLKGDTGETGQTGQTGPAGADGFSPEVTISSIAGGHRVTITDEDHPTGQSFNVMDGSGSGDMLAAAYDPNGDVATAGGISDYVSGAISGKADASSLAGVATSGSYNDLSNKPTIPAAQVNTDWNASSGVAQILNKPTIPAAQIQSDWSQTNTSAKDYIKNKPTIPAAQIQSDWNQTNTSSKDFIKNKPTIPAAQVNSDWDASSGVSAILNKPTIPDVSKKYDTSDTAETALADGDYFPFYDTSASGRRKTLWSNIKSVLKTYFDTLYNKITVAISWTGTASASAVRYQQVTIDGTSTEIGGTKYLESSTKTTSSGVDTFTFTNSNITSSACFDIYCDKPLVSPSAITQSSTTLTVQFKSTDSVTKCRVYIK